MACDFEPETLSLRNSSALASPSVPSSNSCIASALSVAVSAASTSIDSNVVTTGRVATVDPDVGVGIVQSEVDHHPLLDEVVDRVVVRDSVEHRRVDLGQLVGICIETTHRVRLGPVATQ